MIAFEMVFAITVLICSLNWAHFLSIVFNCVAIKMRL